MSVFTSKRNADSVTGALVRAEPPAAHKFGCATRKGGACDCPVEVEQDGDEDEVEPPSEQPSRQETPGGETIDWSRFVPPTKAFPFETMLPVPRLGPGEVRASTWGLEYGAVFMVGSQKSAEDGIWNAEWLAVSGSWDHEEAREDREIGEGSNCARHSIVVRHADGRWADGYNQSGPCKPFCGATGPRDHSQCRHRRAGTPCACSEFCADRFADRAKAKAAEQVLLVVTIDKVTGEPLFSPAEPAGNPGELAAEELRRRHFNCGHPPSGDTSCHLEPAQPSGAGQLPSAPPGFRVVGRSGPGVPVARGSTMIVVARLSDGSPTNADEPRRADSKYDVSRRLWDAGCYDILEPIAEPPARAACEPWCGTGKGPDTGLCDMTWCSVECSAACRPINPRPPAPAGGTLSDIINGLPEPVRRLVHDIETNCDPTGTVRDNVLMRDQVAALEARLAQVESEWRVRYDAAIADGRTLREALERAELESGIAQRDLVESTGLVAEYQAKLVQAERERDDEMRGKMELRRLHGARENETWRDFLTRVVSERDEARAMERARCEVAVIAELQRFKTACRHSQFDEADIREAVRSGAPAPGTGQT